MHYQSYGRCQLCKSYERSITEGIHEEMHEDFHRTKKLQINTITVITRYYYETREHKVIENSILEFYPIVTKFFDEEKYTITRGLSLYPKLRRIEPETSTFDLHRTDTYIESYIKYYNYTVVDITKQ